MTKVSIEHQTILDPGYLPDNPKDGLGMSREGVHFVVKDTIVDLSDHHLDDIDEAGSVTWGSSAYLEKCEFIGAGKLFLCGSGDDHKKDVEKDKTVIFVNCRFKNFSRRGVEVQSGMKVIMYDCTIEGWGEPSRFTVNSYAAKAHHGGRLICHNCQFVQHSFWKGWKQMLVDFGHTFWQSVFIDDPFFGLFKLRTWIPGVCQGLIAGKNGSVAAYNCRKNRWWIYIQNNREVEPRGIYDYLDRPKTMI